MDNLRLATDRLSNPFNVTKAVDFSDREIAATWVDLHEDGGFVELINPRSPMPRFIVGGKGIGRTHIMRYLSSPLQILRNRKNPAAGIKADKYVGIYFRASGLNAGRFNGKGQSPDVWYAVFMYYFDLWVAQNTISAIREVFEGNPELHDSEPAIVHDALGLCDVLVGGGEIGSLESYAMALHRLQRELDSAINNAALTRKLDVTIRETPGSLVFGLPAVLNARLRSLAEVRFLYLLDELENYTGDQQKYIQTLLREKTEATSFMLGARLYGIRTYETSTGEENKEGSEFESIHLDRMYLDQPDRFTAFCRDMLAQRLVEAGRRDLSHDELVENLDRLFFEYDRDRFGSSETAFVENSKRSGDRVYFETLKTKLLRHADMSERQAGLIVDRLRIPEYPLLEKLSTFILYQEWYRQKDLVEAAENIRLEAEEYRGGASDGRYATRMGHFRGDLLAQLLREYGEKQRYLGLNTLIRLSAGLPRILIVLLKYIYRWGVFRGEAPFLSGEPISEESQRPGVLEASEWFLRDSPSAGERGVAAQDSVRRLGDFFRRLRFTDKPVESSLATFTVDINQLTDRARDTVSACQEFSFLVADLDGQRHRNTAAVNLKLQLHPILCPGWDLPIARRGATPLSPAEANAIFDSNKSGDLAQLIGARVARMNAPFRREDLQTLLLAEHE